MGLHAKGTRQIVSKYMMVKAHYNLELHRCMMLFGPACMRARLNEAHMYLSDARWMYAAYIQRFRDSV